MSQYLVFVLIILFVINKNCLAGMDSETKRTHRLKVIEMFKHAYNAYMNHAFPADELMPLSCKGRYRGSEPSRGDIDDSLGNFTLTLIDSLDTLAVLGDIEEFEKAVRLVIIHTKFDTDVIVSVFETNIRVLGGLLGGHVIAAYFKRRKYAMDWYKDELLTMATDIGTRLLPAFNTTTGIPYPRVNLKFGIDSSIASNYRDTCTACAGTMILEFAALSRLTGDPVFEEKAHKAMDYLWNQRHRSSDLVGTVINIHNGDWIRRESGVGAGIDSYYEYVLKAYILLGDDTYLTRFNKHYDAVKKYIIQGPRFVDVHMHRPQATSRSFMDALLAFWPGLQVLKGDIQPAIEVHEMLYQVIKRHNFLPEAFTADFHVHWSHHPLRPEFVESTYFLYKATGDPHYLEVGQKVIENLEEFAKVKCGYAAINDVTKGTHEDQLDSYVFAEMFKYLYLLYAEKSDMLFDVDDYIFTTEAHLLPLSLSRSNSSRPASVRLSREMYSHLMEIDDNTKNEDEYGNSDHNTCPNPQVKFRMNYAQNFREGLKNIMESQVPTVQILHQCPQQIIGVSSSRLKAVDFIAGDPAHLSQLNDMGIKLMTMADGRIQLLHTASEAASPQLAQEGLLFMQEMIELSKLQPQEAQNEPLLLKITYPNGSVVLKAGPAQFGYDLKTRPAVSGKVVIGKPYKMCSSNIENAAEMKGKIVIIERGSCMFVDKARHLQKAGAVGGIVIDHNVGSSTNGQPLFAMSGDGNDDIYIPVLFLFHVEGLSLLTLLDTFPDIEVIMAASFDVAGPNAPKGPSSTTDQSHEETKSGDTLSSKSQNVPAAQKSDNANFEQSQPGLRESFLQRNIELHPLKDYNNYGEESKEKVKEASKESVNSGGSPSDESEVTNIKQLLFEFDKLIQSENGKHPTLSELYEAFSKFLYEKTNFRSLDKAKQSDYLNSIVRLIQSAYLGTRQPDRKSQDLFEQLANELKIVTPKPWENFSSNSDHLGKNSPHDIQPEANNIQLDDKSDEDVKVLTVGGIGVRITTKVVRPVPQSGEITQPSQEQTHKNIPSQEHESYANENDFQESEYSLKSGENLGNFETDRQVMHNQLTGNTEDETHSNMESQSHPSLNSKNPDSAEGLKTLKDKTLEEIQHAKESYTDTSLETNENAQRPSEQKGIPES